MKGSVEALLTKLMNKAEERRSTHPFLTTAALKVTKTVLVDSLIDKAPLTEMVCRRGRAVRRSILFIVNILITVLTWRTP